MKSERKASNLRRQVMEIEVKEGKLKHRKHQILEELRRIEESVSQTDGKPNYGVLSNDESIEELGDVSIFTPEGIDVDSWANAVAYCVMHNWELSAQQLLDLAKSFSVVTLEEATRLLAEEAPDTLKLRPPEGGHFTEDSFVFAIPKILVLQ